MGGDLPLFRRLPALAERAPRIPLGSLPTPVHRLELEGLEGEVWVKRDDLSAEAYGGNKVRKLEFLLAEARRRRAGRVVTAGALGSHHALATAVYGRRLGFPVTLVLSPQKPTDHVRRVLLADHALGADLRLARRMELIPLGLLMERIRRRRERPFLIPPGGSDARGTLGYVNAALELVEQVDAGLVPMPRTVHVACGTMGTAGGLALGFALAGAPVRVSAVRVVGRMVTNRPGLRRLLRATRSLLRSAGARSPPLAEALGALRMRHGQIGKGYGRETEAGNTAAARFGHAGLTLDPTYTAKAAAALLAELEEGTEGPHLYWHTLSHGMPEVSAGAAAVGGRELPEEFRPFVALRSGPDPGVGSPR